MSLGLQVGGKHYKGLAIQPVELAVANQYDPCTFSSLKYVMRHRLKTGAVDLEKGAHFCFLRSELIGRYGRFPKPLNRIPILRAAKLNDAPDAERHIMVLLDEWSRGYLRMPDNRAAEMIAAEFDALRRSTYPQRGTLS